ncbi:MAG: hypothetical protein HW383_294 [Candidatus Magasanikbacteria bacterium]|nr:hypothetical protein [Candidatus Magasanikbacteria bacterium]
MKKFAPALITALALMTAAPALAVEDGSAVSAVKVEASSAEVTAAAQNLDALRAKRKDLLNQLEALNKEIRRAEIGHVEAKMKDRVEKARKNLLKREAVQKAQVEYLKAKEAARQTYLKEMKDARVAFDKAQTDAKTAYDTAAKAARDAKDEAAMKAAKDVLNAAREKARDAFEAAKKAAQDKFEAAKNAAKDAFEAAKEAAKNVIPAPAPAPVPAPATTTPSAQ